MSRHSDLLRDVVVVLFLWLLVVGFFWRIGPAGRVLAGGDVFAYFYPYWAEATRAIRAGRLPLWNPFLFMGAPFLANSQVGFFYPLNWPLWLLFPADRSVHLTIVLHLCLAALNAYLWGRSSLRLGRLGAWAVGAVFSLSGYLGAQAEHVNQLQGLAWLPLMLMLYDQLSDSRSRASSRRKAFFGVAALIGLVVLAGHAQTGFISLFGLAAYGIGPALWFALRNRDCRAALRRAVLFGLTVAVGTGLAAVQIAPTWELAQRSVRAQGLPLNERVSFSLSPLDVGRALLPRFARAVPPDDIEHVAYLGIAGLALAIVGLTVTVRRRREQRSIVPFHSQSVDVGVLVLTCGGLFFALGLYNPLYLLFARYIPGFAHFRVPARWLALYVVGAAACAGRGVETIWRGEHPRKGPVLAVVVSLLILILWAVGGAWWGEGQGLGSVEVVAWVVAALAVVGMLLAAGRAPRLVVLVLLATLIAELCLASLVLPHARATAPQAFTSLRPALAHLLDPEPRDVAPGGRFLSMSDTTFDPGDLSLIETIYGPQLTAEQLYEFVVATKQKEIASPNLPLAFRVPAVDGYDGGVLPLERYVMLQRLLLPVEDVSIDGRLRENLASLPDGRWLSVFNVQYLVTDKLRDAWIGDVFYDLEHGVRLSEREKAQVPHVPRFEATAVGLVSHLEGAAEIPEGLPVGVVSVGFDDGTVRTFELRAGEQVPRAATDQGEADCSAHRLRWAEPGAALTMTLEATLPQGRWVVRGMSLIDERTGAFQSLVVSDGGRFRLVHSGDVKIYENLDVLPRAFVVPRARVVANDQLALRGMQEPSFDPVSELIVHADDPPCCTQDLGGTMSSDSAVGPDRAGSVDVTITEYLAERVVVEVELDEPGYLVLTDAWHPGWRGMVDGERVPVCRADLLFRAIALEPGEHQIVFVFRPVSLAVGGVMSVISLVLLVLVSRWIFR